MVLCPDPLALIVAGKPPAIDAPSSCSGGLVVGAYAPVVVHARVGDRITTWFDASNNTGRRSTDPMWSGSAAVVRTDGSELVAVGPGTALVGAARSAEFSCNASGRQVALTRCPLWRIDVR